VSEGDESGGGTAGGVGGDEEAAWRDLIARYEMPIDGDAASVPWPDREALPDQPAADGTGTADSAVSRAGGDGPGDGRDASSTGNASSGAGTGAAERRNPGKEPGGAADSGDSGGPAGKGSSAPGADTPQTRRSQPPGAGRTRVIRPAAPPPAAPPEPPATPEALASPQPPAGPRDYEVSDADDDTGEHYIPPAPPPLPHLDPIAKGAWTALFGGPAYLFLSTLLGWKAPGWAAFLAVAAFVGGFAVIVLRLGDRPSRGDGPDNGAVL
jgi:hypothetical protein